MSTNLSTASIRAIVGPPSPCPQAAHDACAHPRCDCLDRLRAVPAGDRTLDLSRRADTATAIRGAFLTALAGDHLGIVVDCLMDTLDPNARAGMATELSDALLRCPYGPAPIATALRGWKPAWSGDHAQANARRALPAALSMVDDAAWASFSAAFRMDAGLAPR